MPGYVERALKRFSVTRPSSYGTLSPMVYTPPKIGQATDELATEDTSPPLPPDRVKWIQQVLGVFLYYARAVDPSMLTALNKIATLQRHATEHVENKVKRFLRYAATYPDASITYQASKMCLIAHSDASYLSESESRSRGGGIQYLGNSLDDCDTTHINAPVECISTILPSVVSSAGEAEYASLFITGQIVVGIRSILHDLGYPQGPTTIVTDNACATGIANGKVKMKKSRSIQMRFHWTRDRVAQQELNVIWKPGTDNLADFFTKALPVHRHQYFRKLLLT